LSKFITLQDLRNDKECSFDLFVFQEAGLDKIDFEKIGNLEIPEQYWNKFLWLIRKFKLTVEVTYVDGSTYKYQKGNKIRFDDRKGNWGKSEYDSSGNLIKETSSSGFWEKFQYDKRSFLTRSENSLGNWTEIQYDKNGNKTKFENSYGMLKKWEYDEFGNKIKYENVSINGYWKKMKYDQVGNLVIIEDSTGDWEKWLYNKNEEMIYHEKADGFLEVWEEDQKGQLIKVCCRQATIVTLKLIDDLKAAIAQGRLDTE